MRPTSNDLRLVNLRRTKPNATPSWANSKTSTLHNLILAVPSHCSTSRATLTSNHENHKICIMHEENIRQDSSWRYVIQRALSNPEEIHMLDNRLRTALHCACAKRAPLEVVRILLTARGDGTISCDRNGNGNNESHMKSLLLKQDNHGRTPISVAIANNASLDVVQYLLRRCPESSKVADKSHNFPLHIACMGDYNENTVVVVLELLEAFKDAAGMLSRDKKTPLSLCVECGGSLAVLQALVKADPRTLSIRGCGDTPLQIAIKINPSVPIISCLMDGDPSVAKMVDDNGTTPLHQAIEFRCSMEVVRVLVSDSKGTRSDNVLAIDRTGCTPVHLAVKHRNRPYEIVKELVRRCPEVVHCRNKAGENALDLIYSRYLKQRQFSTEAHQKSLWKTLIFLLRVYTDCPGRIWNSDDDKQEDGDANNFDDIGYEKNGGMKNTLHLMLQTNVPQQIVSIAIERDPDAPRYFDEKMKCLPIFHLAYNTIIIQKEQIIQLLLRKYPSCTKVADGNGDLFLGRIIAHTVPSAELLREIIDSNPRALEISDSSSGLYPFMLAAILRISKTSTTNKDHAFSEQFKDWGFIQNQSHLQLDAIFTLMREKPDLVEMAIPINTALDIL